MVQASSCCRPWLPLEPPSCGHMPRRSCMSRLLGSIHSAVFAGAYIDGVCVRRCRRNSVGSLLLWLNIPYTVKPCTDMLPCVGYFACSRVDEELVHDNPLFVDWPAYDWLSQQFAVLLKPCPALLVQLHNESSHGCSYLCCMTDGHDLSPSSDASG